MKYRYYILFIWSFGFTASHAQVPQAGKYAQTIVADKIADADLQLSIGDLKTYLKKITGNDFVLKDSRPSSAGVFVKLLQPGLLSSQQFNQLSSGSIEDFVIRGNEKQLLLVAKHPLGLCHAIYTYLDLLGVKWYYPGSLWEYVPQKTDIHLTLDKYFAPSFKLRNFFGTGAIIVPQSLDPDSQLQKEWSDWKRRNRMNGEVQLAGHYGEAFNIKYRQILEQHPEYLAMINGKRQSWTPSTKLCISNPAVQKLYIEDRVAEAKTLLSAKNASEKITVSVEPSDGDGDCECDACKKMGTVSNRDYYLANEVAKAFEKLSPRLYANLYAYNTHAAPPSCSLSSQQIVQIVPYAFQRVASPKEFIEQWGKKSSSLMLYDYFGIPDWSYNLPLSGEYSQDKLLQKIKHWHAQGIKGFTLESSYSIGGNGLGLYLASRLGWDIHTNVEEEKNLFYKNLFVSSPAMKNFFQKLNSDFNGSPDLPYLLKQLSTANDETKGNFSERISCWQQYLHYTLLFYSFQNASEKEKEAKWQNLMQYIWRIYFTAMIHTSRLSELLSNRFDMPTSLTTDWNNYSASAKNLQHLSPLSANELQKFIQNDMKAYPLLKDFPYTTKKIPYKLIAKSQTADAPNDGIMILEFPETYAQPQSDGTIRFWIKTNEGSAENDNQTISVRLIDTARDKIIDTRTMNITKNWDKVVFNKLSAGSYKIEIENKNWIRFYSSPSQWLAFATIPVHAVLGKLYFQIPSSTTSFYYTNASVDQPIFKTNSGAILKTEKINDQNLYRVTVSSSDSPQTITIEGSEYKYLHFYSVPGIFFLYSGYNQVSRQ
jgi:hypothetical protein